MKKCRRCAKTATLHITEVRDGQAAVVHLCESCARQYLDGMSGDGPGGGVSDLESKLEAVIADGRESPATCPECGIAFNEFRESGRFGCANDYVAFADELLPLLENIHEDSQHTGKRPRSLLIGTEAQAQLIRLRHELQLAVASENYEAAAQLRDQIAGLEADARARTFDS
jgi:protein arginine kinase activator